MFKSTPIVKKIFWINVILYVSRLIIEPMGFPLINYMALYPLQNDSFHLYQFITHLFTHTSFLHIFFNMLVFLSFAPKIEELMGSKKFLYFYMISGLIASIIQIQFIDNPLVGASGAVYAVLMYFILMNPNADLYLFGLIKFKAKILGIFIIGYEIYSALWVESNIGNIAHLGGIASAISFFIINKFKNGNKKDM